MPKTKPIVHCYIYDKYNERGVTAFEKRVSTMLKRAGIKAKTDNPIICHNSYMKGAGRNNYLKFAEIKVDREIYTLTEHTHDSQLWDSWENPTPKDKRNLFLAVLESNIDTLKELIQEEEKGNEI